LNAEIAATPGVLASSQSWAAVPLSSDDEQRFWMANEEKPTTQNGMKWAVKYLVDPSYLQVMQIPLMSGRFFTDQDNEKAPKVIVIDQAFAQRYFGHENPVGKVLNLEGFEKPLEIVGVVGHVNQWGFDRDDQSLREQLYMPFMQMNDQSMVQASMGSMVLLRTQGDVPGIFESIHRSITRVNSGNTVYGSESMKEIIADTLANRRFSMILFEIFAGMALLLASIGLYGVIAYAVGQRTHEFGVRMALGARASDILRLVLAGGGKLVGIGIALGLIAAALLGRFMSSLLLGISTTDPMTYGTVAGLLLFVAVIACLVPARRATKVDPMVALRYE
jgi:predicted permease